MKLLTLLPVAALSLAACGSDSGVSIEDAWARTSPASTSLGAIYFDLTVDDDDTLVSADVPDSVADHAEIHEVVAAEMADADMDDGEMSGDMESGDMDDSGDMDGSDEMDSMEGDEGDMDGEMSEMEGMGAMRMQELTDGLPLTGGETVSLEPGGYHVMLIDLVEPLETGDEIELTLEFAEAGTTTVTVEVAESAP